VENGALTLQGKTTFRQNVSEHSMAMATFQGGVEISQLTLDDPMQDQSFITWQRLGLQELDLHIEPTSVHLQTLELVNPSIVLLIDQDGKVNFTRLFSPPGSPSDEETLSEKEEEKEEEDVEDQDGAQTPVKVAAVRIID